MTAEPAMPGTGRVARRRIGVALVTVAHLLAFNLLAPTRTFAEVPASLFDPQPAAAKISLRTVPPGEKTVQSVAIVRDKSTLIETEFRVTRVAVGNPEIADFVAISNREIEVLAREVGDTNLLIWGDGRLQAVIDISVEGIQPHIARELRRLLDNPSIRVDMAGGSVILRGNVPNLVVFEQAGRIAHAFLSRGRRLIVGEQDPVEGTSVINLLQVGGGHQVMIEVVIAELRRNVRRALGVNVLGKIHDGSNRAATFQTLLRNLTSHGTLIGSGAAPIGPGSMSESISLAGSLFSSGDLDLRLFLEAVETNELGTILAEPTVVARSGEQASFLVGGEIPIPIVSSLEQGEAPQFSIRFKKFGVGVEFTPTVLDEKRIHLRITPEVSEPDFTLGVSVLGAEIPAFQTRRVDTSVELGDGESFVLAGLLREDIVADLEKFPFIGDIPILGQLFTSRAFQKKQTELVLIVTPRLVQPLAPGTEIPLPTENYIEPTLAEFYWGARIEGKSPPSDDERGPAHEDRAPRGSFAPDPARDDPAEVVSRSSRAAFGAGPELGGFIGPFGHRLRTPQPVGVTEQ